MTWATMLSKAEHRLSTRISGANRKWLVCCDASLKAAAAAAWKIDDDNEVADFRWIRYQSKTLQQVMPWLYQGEKPSSSDITVLELAAVYMGTTLVDDGTAYFFTDSKCGAGALAKMTSKNDRMNELIVEIMKKNTSVLFVDGKLNEIADKLSRDLKWKPYGRQRSAAAETFRCLTVTFSS
jgi:hypothetical protein